MTESAGPLPLTARLPGLLARWQRASRHYRLLPYAYVLCLCSMMLVRGNIIPQSLYYAAVLPLAALSGLRFARRAVGSSLIFWGCAIYLAAIGLSSFLQDSSPLALVGGYFRRSAMALTFLLATAYLMARSRRFLPSLLVVLCTSASASALINIAILYGRSPVDSWEALRLVAAIGLPGYGNATNIALTYAVLLVGAIGSLMAGGLSRLQRYLLSGATIVLLLALLLTQARGPMTAAFVASVVLAAVCSRWRLFFAGIAAALASIVALAASPVLRHVLLGRGDSFRMELWHHYLRAAADQPWLGYGLFADIRVRLPEGITILHAHNLLLSAEIRGGALASLAMIVWLAAALFWAYRLWQARRMPIPLGLLLTIVLAGSVDYELFSTSPDWVWLTFWLPVGTCLGAEMLFHTAGRRGHLPTLSHSAGRR